MMTFIEIVLLLAGLLLAVPSVFLLIECLMGIHSGLLCTTPVGSVNPRVAVVIPAHNEESIIADTVRSVSRHLREQDRILVVADNCTDDTAEKARAAGAEIVERCDESRRGKGYALAHGIRYLAADPPAVVVFLDADTTVEEGSLPTLSELAVSMNRPVQSLFLCLPPPSPTPRDLISAFAYRVRNLVRVRGLYRLAGLCRLTGSGIALPWQLAQAAPLDSGHLVEDMQLGIDLAVQGSPPLLCDHVRVTGVLPQGPRAARIQRTRWEHGHLRTLCTQVPRLAIQALRQKRIDLALLGLDLAVPPIAFLLLCLSCLAVATGLVAAFDQQWAPLIFAVLNLALMIAAISIAWWKTARHDTPAWVLLLVPLYLLWKVPIYARWCLDPQREWTQTPRPYSNTPPGAGRIQSIDASVKQPPTSASQAATCNSVTSARYVIISPCRDEAAYARRTLESVTRQTVPPTLWVIVDDGSTDQTPQILAEYAQRFDYIRVIRREDRGRRSVGPGVIDAFYAGYSSINPEDFEYVCKLDLDLQLPPRYFELIIQRMQADPRLGTCSGKPYYDAGNGSLVPETCGDDMSVGAAKFYRTVCFEAIGGFVRQVMWDGIDCHYCRMLGWTAFSWDDPELRFLHLRPMGSSDRGILTGRARHGAGQYVMGTGMLYILASALFRFGQRPALIGSIAMLWGYFGAMLAGRPRYPDRAFREHLRRYQLACLRHGKDRAMHLMRRTQTPARKASDRCCPPES